MNIPEYYKSPTGRIFGVFRGKSEVKDPTVGRIGKYFTIAVMGSGARNFQVSEERYVNAPPIGAPCFVESPLTVFASSKDMIVLQNPTIRVLKSFPADPNTTDLFQGVGKLEKRPVNANRPDDFYLEFRAMGFVTTIKVSKDLYDSLEVDSEKYYKVLGNLKSAGGYRQLEGGRAKRIEVYAIADPKFEVYEYVAAADEKK